MNGWRISKAGIPLASFDDGFLVFRSTHMRRFAESEKDFSLSLEMTIRESGILALLPSPRGEGFGAGTRLSLLPMEGGAL